MCLIWFCAATTFNLANLYRNQVVDTSYPSPSPLALQIGVLILGVSGALTSLAPPLLQALPYAVIAILLLFGGVGRHLLKGFTKTRLIPAFINFMGVVGFGGLALINIP